ncbi:MAG: hypothetical protein GF383_10705 [Candidatus Lokiarchaeota archaeon]|nr:hypothetical protein [Candidatus Lokiarchaeota archaeon]MBD3341063.1 hypothetical protein [Candidatus Lokiarchaeota archaeon]
MKYQGVELSQNEARALESIGIKISLRKKLYSSKGIIIKNGHIVQLSVENGENANLESEELSHLTYLNFLDLSENYLDRLPEWIQELKELKDLRLNNNILTQLPEWIGNLKELEALSLIGNRLTSLPQSLANLKKLKTLRLDNNHIKKFPLVLNDLRENGLEYIYLDENPLNSLSGISRKHLAFFTNLILSSEFEDNDSGYPIQQDYLTFPFSKEGRNLMTDAICEPNSSKKYDRLFDFYNNNDK